LEKALVDDADQNKILEEFKCRICYNIAYEPIDCINCENSIVCKVCLE
jgi:hypothetical protein